MKFDIVEAIRQKQRTYVRAISIENGDEIVLNIRDGKIIVRRAHPPDRVIEETIEPA